MKVFVINEDQIKHYALMLLAALIVSFFLGYFTGFKKSAVDDAVLIEQEAHEEALLNASNEGPQLTANNSVKVQPQALAKIKKIEQNKKAQKNPVAKKISSIQKTQQTKIAKKEAEKQQKTKAKSMPLKKDVSKVKSSTAAIESQSDTARLAAFETANHAEKKPASTDKVYSIQAGMFASRSNAQSFIAKLAEKEFDAYVRDFESSPGNIKYNVRVGRFAQREAARQRLKQFQVFFSSPAYVVISQ